MAAKFRITGLRELERALAELPRATGKNVLRRVAKGALEPMRADAEARAPVQRGHLKTQVVVSAQRTKRVPKTTVAVRVNGKWRRARSNGIEMAMGPASGRGVLNYATFDEFGRHNQAPQPYMRPAWDTGARAALEYIRRQLAIEIGKSAARLARKRARAAR